MGLREYVTITSDGFESAERKNNSTTKRGKGMQRNFNAYLARATVPKLALAPSMIEAFAASEQVESVLSWTDRRCQHGSQKVRPEGELGLPTWETSRESGK